MMPSFRSLWRSPAFALSAIAILALGIGATITVFSIVNAVLFRPLPYPDSDRIVQVMVTSFYGAVNMTSLSRFVFWRDYTRAFDLIAAYDLGQEIAGIQTQHVSADYFPLFGAQMQAGRPFDRNDDRPGGPAVAVVSDDFWRRQLMCGLDLQRLSVRVDQESYTVIGVMRPGFQRDPRTDVWIPLQAPRYSLDHSSRLRMAAHLNAGVNLAMAQRQLRFAAVSFHQTFPDASGPNESATAEPLRDIEVGDVRTALFLLLSAVGVVLLIGCVNLANLSLARGARRTREIATRSLLGASSRHIVGPLLGESLILSLAGGSLGVAVAWLAIPVLLAMNPGNLPRLNEGVPLDRTVLVFALGASITTGVLFAMLPAWQAIRIDPAAATRRGSSYGSTAPLAHNRLLSSLVAVEIALAMVLLMGAGLLLQTYVRTYRTDRGFDTHQVLTLETELADDSFRTTAALAMAERETAAHIEAIGGVYAAGAAWSIPLEPNMILPFTVIGRERLNRYDGSAVWHGVSGHYFDAYHIAIRRGRNFVDSDTGGQPVVIISETMALKFWPGSNPVGHKIWLGENLGPEFADEPREIVGVAADVRDIGLDQNPEPAVYIPLSQTPERLTARNRHSSSLKWVVRVHQDGSDLRERIRTELGKPGRGFTVGRIRSMDEVLAASTARITFNTVVISAFAAMAAVLAILGVYGLGAYSAEQRLREIGIRVALGAGPAEIDNLFLGEALWRSVIGIGCGSVLALAVMKWLQSRIFGVIWDPITLIGVGGILAAASVAATYIPTRHALRADPVGVLRTD